MKLKMNSNTTNSDNLVAMLKDPAQRDKAFGIFMKNKVRDRYVPLAAIVAPVLCYILHTNSEAWFNGYKFSYELLIFNALFTFIGLCLLIKKEEK